MTPQSQTASTRQPLGHPGPVGNGAPTPSPASDAIELLQLLQRRRTVFTRTANRIGNASGALVRRELGWRYDLPEKERERINKKAAAIAGSILKGTTPESWVDLALDLEPYRLALAPINKARASVERAMEKLARQLPVYAWTSSIKGLGDKTLAIIVAEAGDLASYPHRDKLWKRFGLTPYDGHAASSWRRRATVQDLAGDEGRHKLRALSAEEWERIGYAPRRNAETYACIAQPMIKHAAPQYRAVYDREKARFLAAGRTKMHAHMHGLRCLRKAVLEDLWRVWTGRAPRHV